VGGLGGVRGVRGTQEESAYISLMPYLQETSNRLSTNRKTVQPIVNQLTDPPTDLEDKGVGSNRLSTNRKTVQPIVNQPTDPSTDLEDKGVGSEALARHEQVGDDDCVIGDTALREERGRTSRQSGVWKHTYIDGVDLHSSGVWICTRQVCGSALVRCVDLHSSGVWI
jgi:hypothetical protein